MFKYQGSELDLSSHDLQRHKQVCNKKLCSIPSLKMKYFYCSGECVLGSIGVVLCSVGSLFQQKIIF